MHMAHHPDLDVSALRCFALLMEERSVTRAADRMGLTQSALSHALARLRVRFADPLFVRGAEGMLPTPRAIEIHEDALPVLAGLDRIDARRQGFTPHRERSRFVVTVTDYFERLLAPPLLARLQQAAPGVCVEWRAPDPASARGWLERGEVDLRLGWVHAPWPGLRFSKLFDDRLVCLARTDHPAVGRSLRIADFFELAHVRPAIAVAPGGSQGNAATLTLEQYLGISGSRQPASVPSSAASSWQAHRSRSIRVVMLGQSFLTMPYLVAGSDAIATVPALTLHGALEHLPVRVLEPPLRLPVLQGALYWHERTNADPRQRWFRGLVAEVARTISTSTAANPARRSRP